MKHVSILMLIGAVVLPPHLPPPGVHGTMCESSARWESLIRTHVTRYPDMQVADLYKLLHQATLGSEHAVPSAEAAERWLARELNNLPEGPPEPLVDTLGHGGRLARIHLRPFRALGRPQTDLLTAFVATASGRYGDRSELECAMAVARELSRQEALPWAASRVAAYLAARASRGYPAVHHSSAYERHYRPAYRVVAVELVSEVIGNERERGIHDPR